VAWVALAEILQSNSKAPNFDALAPFACKQSLSQKLYIQGKSQSVFPTSPQSARLKPKKLNPERKSAHAR
jgi:hypothetical protein